MKIFKTLPKGENLSHDGALIRVVRLALPAFIIISSITVFGGVKSYLTQYLIDSYWYASWSLLGVGYVFFSLAPDLLNAVACAYVARSFIKGHHKERLCAFLVAFCICLIIPLTRYSFKMSKVSASALVEDAAPKIEKPNVAPIDDLYQDEINRITAEYEQEKTSIEGNYQMKLEAVRKPFLAQIEAKEKQIERYERNRNEGNTQWTDKKIVQVREAIAQIEGDRIKAELPLMDKKLSLASSLKSNKDDRINEARTIRLEDRQFAKDDNQKERSKIEETTTIIDNQFSGLAGYAVFIVLMLTIVLEVLEHRNEIENDFVFTLWDGGLSPLVEVVGYPFTARGRKWINKVRRKYAELPEMEEPVLTKIKHHIPSRDTDKETPTPLKEQKTRRRTTRQRKKKAVPINLLANLSSNISSNSNKAPTIQGRLKTDDTGSNVSLYENRIYDTKAVATGSNRRNCAHCNSEFTYNHKKQKYCSDDCRKKAWEQRTNRKLKLKAKKR